MSRLLITALLVALAGAAATLPGAESDQELETFLLEAEVVSMRNLMSGISAPARVVLSREGEERNAIFKVINVGPGDVERARDAKRGFTDSYRYEIAAYRLDRLLGLHMVPVTIFRNISASPGSIQAWIEDNINEETRKARGSGPEDEDLLERQLELMRFFDYLIANEDRNEWNLLYTPEDWKLHLSDHSRAFRTKSKRPPARALAALNRDPALEERLAALDRPTLEESLEGLLDEEQVSALLARRDRLLSALGG